MSKNLSSIIKMYLGISPIVIIIMTLQLIRVMQDNQTLKKEYAKISNTGNNLMATLNAGQKIEHIKLPDLQGQTQEFPKTNQNTLIFVFSTNCPACQKNAENWNKIYSKVDKSKFYTLGLSISPKESTRSFASSKNFGFPVISLEGNDQYKEVLKLHRYPQTILVNNSGMVEKIWIGLLKPEHNVELSKAFNIQLL